ncbi:hypothetical protein [Acetobacter fallax]|uniref:Uncharacterized protein n=1 Tax=Acetobacter fallax TaxID=1737473 RepID=A0ABX0K6V7_9PROT|nr:hypothetical protein [Acetobacter fallax]NHO31538.1 hypothetical protein [Acetobacter fallax]NHO35097.1 hypothetical protein [Acetobacter fallax]
MAGRSAGAVGRPAGGRTSGGWSATHPGRDEETGDGFFWPALSWAIGPV